VPLEPPERWDEVEGALQREFRFKDFAQAIDFVNRVAEIAEEAHHHPDIAVHWNHVTLRWWTHTTDGIHPHRDSSAERREGAAQIAPAGPVGSQNSRSEGLATSADAACGGTCPFLPREG